MLLSKPEWRRSELTVMARERGLPLDGLLERLNEASYDTLDRALFEDGDPLVLDSESAQACQALCDMHVASGRPPSSR